MDDSQLYVNFNGLQQGAGEIGGTAGRFYETIEAAVMDGRLASWASANGAKEQYDAFMTLWSQKGQSLQQWLDGNGKGAMEVNDIVWQAERLASAIWDRR
jgi:hypothetical protein